MERKILNQLIRATMIYVVIVVISVLVISLAF